MQMELTEEVCDLISQCTEYTVLELARRGWKPPREPLREVACMWCKQRMHDSEWRAHRPRCEKNPKVIREKERLTRIARHAAKLLPPR